MGHCTDSSVQIVVMTTHNNNKLYQQEIWQSDVEILFYIQIFEKKHENMSMCAC